MRTFLFGLLLGILLLPVAALVYFRWGHPPVAVGDRPFPMEATIVHVPLGARINAEAPSTPPIEPSATNLELGARIYRQQCSSCHGLYGRNSAFGEHMYPDAPQLWKPHGNGVVGVSDDPAGETYWKVANGIRLTGMPAFKQVLNQTEMWQVSVLLANADRTLPTPVLELLKKPIVYDVQAGDAAAAPALSTPAVK